MDDVLLDHAHCEKRAASNAINLIFRYPDKASLAIPLSRLAREELAHFEEVVEILARRGTPYRRIQPTPYAARLTAAIRGEEPGRLIDTLLCCSLIEARSCERMRLLAEHLTDPELVRLYRGLLAAEARHHEIFVDLARELGLVSEDDLRARLDELARHEAEVIATTAPEPRLHG